MGMAHSLAFFLKHFFSLPPLLSGRCSIPQYRLSWLFPSTFLCSQDCACAVGWGCSGGMFASQRGSNSPFGIWISHKRKPVSCHLDN